MAVVLVVEDNSSLRSLVCRHIARRGHKAIAAGTGAEALACAARRVPTIAILSLRLPDTDGLRLFDALRGQQPDLAGVLVIPDGGALSSVEYLDSRISACVEKPFDLDTLGLLIERLDASHTQVESAVPSVVTFADQRLARAILCGIHDLQSIGSLPAWGRKAGCAESTLGSWCKAAGTSAKAVEDFRRGLAAGIAAIRTSVSPRDLLGYADSRSIQRFIERVGPLEENGQPWTPSDYCRNQRALPKKSVIDEVVRLLKLRGLIRMVCAFLCDFL